MYHLWCENYSMSQKYCAKLLLSELCQISTNFDDFWQKDGKETLCEVHSFSTSPNAHHHTTVLNANDPNWCNNWIAHICIISLIEGAM